MLSTTKPQNQIYQSKFYTKMCTKNQTIYIEFKLITTAISDSSNNNCYINTIIPVAEH